MKVGDCVKHKDRDGVATVIAMKIRTERDDFKEKTVVKSTYTARYENGSLLTFYGYDIGKRVFKIEDPNQLSFLDKNLNIKGD